jgi:hypothetical protein
VIRRAAIALAIAAGCGGGASSSSAELVKDVRGYNNGLRWRDFPASALRVVPSLRAAFLDHRERLDDDLRIADWEMTRLEYADRNQRAIVHVEYTWMLDSRGIVHTTVTRQWWSRHGDRWLIHREERLRGEPMPGVAEPHSGKEGTDPRRQRGDSTVNGGPDSK